MRPLSSPGKIGFRGTGSMYGTGTQVLSAPVNTVAPSIDDTSPQVDNVLTASAGTWTGTPSPTFAYQWQRDNIDILGETATTYTVLVTDIGSTLRIKIIATNVVGSAIAFSAETAAVTAAITFATWNPADKDSDIALSNGNLTITVVGGDGGQVRSTIVKATGKWQFETTFVSFDGVVIGCGEIGENLNAYPGIASGRGYIATNGNKIQANISTAYGSAYIPGDVITCYFDATANTIGFKLNGVDQGLTTLDDGPNYFAAIGVGLAHVSTTNFGATPLTYPVAGYNLGLYE